jgi:hypothetical protein
MFTGCGLKITPAHFLVSTLPSQNVLLLPYPLLLKALLRLAPVTSNLLPSNSYRSTLSKLTTPTASAPLPMTQPHAPTAETGHYRTRPLRL